MTDPEVKLRARLSAICGAADLDSEGAELIKFTNNAVFRLRGDVAIVRIAGSVAMHRRTRKIVSVARWLSSQNFPAVRLLSGIEQPVAANGDLATIWEFVPTCGSLPSSGDLGALLRQFHSLPPQVNELPSFDPISDIRWRLSHAEGLDQASLQFLNDQCDQLEGELDQLHCILPAGPVHGDAHPGNLLAGPGGPILCDFDSTCSGPREWDLMPVAFGELRFGGTRSTVDQFMAAYGFDIRCWDGFKTLANVRELKLVTSVVPVLRSNPRVLEEFRWRLESLRDSDGRSRVWNRY